MDAVSQCAKLTVCIQKCDGSKSLCIIPHPDAELVIPVVIRHCLEPDFGFTAIPFNVKNNVFLIQLIHRLNQFCFLADLCSIDRSDIVSC